MILKRYGFVFLFVMFLLLTSCKKNNDDNMDIDQENSFSSDVSANVDDRRYINQEYNFSFDVPEGVELYDDGDRIEDEKYYINIITANKAVFRSPELFELLKRDIENQEMVSDYGNSISGYSKIGGHTVQLSMLRSPYQAQFRKQIGFILNDTSVLIILEYNFYKAQRLMEDSGDSELLERVYLKVDRVFKRYNEEFRDQGYTYNEADCLALQRMEREIRDGTLTDMPEEFLVFLEKFDEIVNSLELF